MVEFYAVDIDDVRAMFGADATLAAELTAAARAAFPAPKRQRRWFSPLMRRSPEFIVDPSRPTQDDLSVLLAGGYVTPERMAATWSLFRALLEHRSAAHVSIDVSSEEWDSIEFDLARSGLDSYYSLRSLGERRLGIPLSGHPGELNGYSKHVHVVETLDALRQVLGEVGEQTREVVTQVIEVGEQAVRNELDLVVLTV